MAYYIKRHIVCERRFFLKVQLTQFHPHWQTAEVPDLGAAEAGKDVHPSAVLRDPQKDAPESSSTEKLIQESSAGEVKGQSLVS